MESFIKNEEKSKIVGFVVLKCMGLCLEYFNKNCNFDDDYNAIEKKFIEMEKADLLKLLDDKYKLLNILKNEIFKESLLENKLSLKNEKKKIVLGVVVLECIDLCFEHFHKKCSFDDFNKIEKTFNKMKKADFLKLLDNKCELLDILQNKIFN